VRMLVHLVRLGSLLEVHIFVLPAGETHLDRIDNDLVEG
jgi:hypothetical protein